MNSFIKIFISLVTLFSSTITSAQFVSAEIGVSGLTCSACTRSVEKSIRKLDFVKDVQMNLKEANGKILFKEGATVSIEKVAKAVQHAGYSVNSMKAIFYFQTLSVSDNFCYSYQSSQFQFVKTGNRTLSGNVELRFIGKDFMDNKEYKTWSELLIPMCFSLSKKLLFVTI